MLNGWGKSRNERRLIYFLTCLTTTVNSLIYMPLKFQIYFLGSFSTAVKSLITCQLQCNLEYWMTTDILEEKLATEHTYLKGRLWADGEKQKLEGVRTGSKGKARQRQQGVWCIQDKNVLCEDENPCSSARSLTHTVWEATVISKGAGRSNLQKPEWNVKSYQTWRFLLECVLLLF